MRKNLLITITTATLILITVSAIVQAQGTVSISPPKLRLGTTVKPTHYSIELTVVPTEDTFNGKADIDLELLETTSLIWLNATELTIKEASLSMGAQAIAARPVAGNEDFLGFAFDRSIGPGAARLHIVYQGDFNKLNTDGLFKQKDGEDWYVF